MPRLLILTAAVLMACGACSSTHGRTVPDSSVGAPSTAVISTGQDAAAIASHIPGCTAVTSGDAGKGTTSGLSSVATCTLAGHLVIIDSFTTMNGPADTAQLAAHTATYWAYCDSGWLAFLADQGATADTTTLQEQITNNAGAVLEESTNGDPHPPASLDAQRTLTGQIAAALAGHVAHTGP